MVRRLTALTLPGLLVSGCAGFPFSTDEYEPGTVVGQTSAVVTNGRIPFNGSYIGIDLPDGTVVPMKNMVDKRGRQYEEVDLAELDRITKDAGSNPTNPSARHQGVGNSPAEMSGGASH